MQIRYSFLCTWHYFLNKSNYLSFADRPPCLKEQIVACYLALKDARLLTLGFKHRDFELDQQWFEAVGSTLIAHAHHNSTHDLLQHCLLFHTIVFGLTIGLLYSLLHFQSNAFDKKSKNTISVKCLLKLPNPTKNLSNLSLW